MGFITTIMQWVFLSEIARIDCTETIFVALNTRDLLMLKENLV